MEVNITYRMSRASEPLPDETLLAVLGTLAQVNELPAGSVTAAKIQASIDLLKTLNR
jgi:hypothetical protein